MIELFDIFFKTLKSELNYKTYKLILTKIFEKFLLVQKMNIEKFKENPKKSIEVIKDNELIYQIIKSELKGD